MEKDGWELVWIILAIIGIWVLIHGGGYTPCKGQGPDCAIDIRNEQL